MKKHVNHLIIAASLVLFLAAGIKIYTTSDESEYEVHTNSFGYNMKMLELIDYEPDSSFAISRKHIYYVGDNDTIYKAELGNVKSKKIIYDYKDTTSGWFSGISIEKRQDRIYFSYHIGNASMGDTYEAEIFPDDSISEPLRVSFGVPSFSGTSEYALDWMTTGSGATSYKAPRYETEKYDYLIAYRPVIPHDASRIYRLDKETQELTMVSDIPTMFLKYRDGKIYFTGNDKKLYCFKPEEEIVTLACQGPLAIDGTQNYEVLNGSIYYINSRDGKMYKDDETEPLNQGAAASFTELSGEYIKLVFDNTENNQPSTIFADSSGQIVLESRYPVYIDSAGEGIIVYYDEETGNVMLRETQ